MSIDSEADRIKQDLQEDEKIKVKVALFGQPGAGKSTLINSLAGLEPPDAAPVGVETDKTVEEVIYPHCDLFLHDLPGYGTQRFPAEGYYERFHLGDKDLFLCVVSGKLHASDIALFKELKDHGKVCLFVVNKSDTLWENGKTIEELKEAKLADIRRYVGEGAAVYFVSCQTKEGLDGLDMAIGNNLDDAKKERWERSAAAYTKEALDNKRRIAEKQVIRYAGLSAANSLNPIPGVNVAVDIGVLVKLFKEIRESYGLSEEKVQSIDNIVTPAVLQTANNIFSYATKDGIFVLLKRFAASATVGNVARYVPFVGQAIAATLGYAITRMAGSKYLEDCHEVASAILASKTQYGAR